MEQLQNNKENTLKLLQVKSMAEAYNLRLSLGLLEDVENTEEINKAIQDLKNLLQEFEKIRSDYQQKINDLTEVIFQRKK